MRFAMLGSSPLTSQSFFYANTRRPQLIGRYVLFVLRSMGPVEPAAEPNLFLENFSCFLLPCVPFVLVYPAFAAR
jgi:hypothetical protein